MLLPGRKGITDALANLLYELIPVVERGSRSPEPTWPAGIEPLPGKRRMKKYGETTLWYAAAGEGQTP